MKRSNRLILLIGIFLALVAFVLIVMTLGSGSGGTTAPSAAPTTAKIVVAAKDIDLGERIQADQVTTKDIAIADRPANAFADTSFVIGQIARAKVLAGGIITSVTLSSTGGVQNIEVPKGFVAMSVQVDQVTGVGTIVKPGDFVDIVTSIATPEKVAVVIPDLSPSPGTYGYIKYPDDQYNHTTVKALSQGVQVLGTLLPPAPQAADQPQASANPGAATTTLNGQQEIVILAVPLQDAEVIKFAQIDGSISLVLRSSEDCTTKPADGLTYCPTVATSGITLRRLVDDRGVLPPTIVQVIQPTPLPGTVPAKTPKP